MSIAVFIVGPPAAGKTTIARRLLGNLDSCTLVAKPKWTLSFEKVCAAGHYTGQTFDGADQVGYNQVGATLDYWRDEFAPTTRLSIFDGDRFSHAGARAYVSMHCTRVCCIYVWDDPIVLDTRRAARNWAPNPTWLKGRETKANRFYCSFPEADRLVAPHKSDAEIDAFLWGAL